MSAARPSLLRPTLAAQIAVRLWPAWCGTPAGYAEAIAVVEGVLEGRIPKWVRLDEVREILALRAKEIGADGDAANERNP